ncbi:MAG: patatin-like phospholipase family protein, partial [Bacteroidetes bacterium]|nr:patatin-like phospholipase family protein [Bacteroidota bacterium]
MRTATALPVRSLPAAVFLAAALLFPSGVTRAQSLPQVPPPSGATTAVAVQKNVADSLKRPRIGLVLSGGGARGLSQVGVLRALEEAGIRPDFIVGTSIGSIVGGLYASGYNARRLEEAMRRIDWGATMRLTDEADRSALSVDQKSVADRSILTIRFDGLQPMLPQSVSNGQRLTNLLNELTLQGIYHATDFDSLGIPFRAVATDLHSGRSVVMRKGSLAESMRASSTIPVMYAAVNRDSMMLVDGGLLANIPTHVAIEAGCDYIIAVNTSSPMRTDAEMRTALEIIDQVFNVVMIPRNTEQLALADAVITPFLYGLSSADFSQVDSLITAGYDAGRQAVVGILKDLYGSAGFPPEHHDVARASAIRLHGIRLLPAATVVGVETRWRGQPMTPEFRRDLSEYILEDYRRRGFSLAHMDSLRIDEAGGVDVYIDEGVVGRISVTGNTRTNDVVILREIPVRAGEVFRVSDLKRGMNNLLALNLFHHVAYDIQHDDSGDHVVIRVVERASQELLTGVMVNNERNAQIGLLLRDANVFGSGTELAASFFSGQSNREYALRYSTNRMFYTPFSLRMEGYYGFRDFNNYEDVAGLPSNRFEREVTFVYRRITYGTSASFGLNVQRFGNLVGTLRYEEQRIRTDQIRRPDAEEFSEDHRLVELSLSSTVDTQDRYPYPRQGVRFQATYASAQTALGSGTAFSKLAAVYDFIIPVIDDVLVVHPRFHFGYGDKTMPRTEEFHLGGLHSFIGLRENEFNGRQIAMGGLEFRFRSPIDILFDTYLSLRYNIGRTWENPELIRIKDLRHGIGLQLGLDTPIGPA